ncbi:hypothetical protein ACSBR1_005928 [Camellia fascicularis]
MMKRIPEMSLCSTNNKAIPLVGFGTAVYPFSEQPLGVAIADAIRLGFIKSHEELFITSKLWCFDAHHDHALPTIQKSLKNLGLEYLDLYLVNWPMSSKPGEYELPVNKQELLPMDLKSVWEAMEECESCPHKIHWSH